MQTYVFQTTQNALYTSKPGEVKYLCKGGKDILWGDIVELVKVEQKSLFVQQYCVSLDHVNLNRNTKVDLSSNYLK